MPNIKISAKREPYRRLGLSHTRAGVVHAADRFAAEQLEQLRNDPHLVIAETDEPPAVLLVDSVVLRTKAFAAFCRNAEFAAVAKARSDGEDWDALSHADRDARINGALVNFIEMVEHVEATRNAEIAVAEPPASNAAQAAQVSDDATTQPPASDATSPDKDVAKPGSKPAAAKASTKGKAK